MGMVFQSYSLFPNMNALNNVAYGLRIRGQRSHQRKKKANEVLALVGLAEARARSIPNVRWPAAARRPRPCACHRARVLLLDEPLSALDAKVRAGASRPRSAPCSSGSTITTVFVTHDQEEALSMADRVCVMSKGRIEQTATPSRAVRPPGNSFRSPVRGRLRAGSRLNSPGATSSSSASAPR